MRVLLTGSSGWLGRTLAPLLTENGHAVTGLDVVPGTHTQVIGTVADRTLIDRTMGEHGIEAIIHGGALHKPDIVRYPRQAFIDVNVTGTLNLIEVWQKNLFQRLASKVVRENHGAIAEIVDRADDEVVLVPVAGVADERERLIGVGGVAGAGDLVGIAHADEVAGDEPACREAQLAGVERLHHGHPVRPADPPVGGPGLPATRL